MLDWFKRIATPVPHAVASAAILSLDGNTRLPVKGRVPAASMPTRVVVVACQKGGAGKTTLAAHLAVRAGMVGHGPAILVDTDPQGSLAEWWRARADESLALASVSPADLAANPGELRNRGAAVAIIDTPPALTKEIEQVIAFADLVLIPARPSPHDLRTIGATLAMARRANKPFLFVVNGAAPRGRSPPKPSPRSPSTATWRHPSFTSAPITPPR